ncbi:Phosphatidylglycerol/phosphatidylinositol transfer protein [Mactra antiquata]
MLNTVSLYIAGSLGGTVSYVDLNPCDKDPCVLHHGTNATLALSFLAKENATEANSVVHGIIGGVPVPFPMPADGCTNHNLKCPIVAGTTIQYNNYIYISPEYPKIRVAVKMEIQDENKQDIICFIIPLSID